jgi:hypothetical protein
VASQGEHGPVFDLCSCPVLQLHLCPILGLNSDNLHVGAVCAGGVLLDGLAVSVKKRERRVEEVLSVFA